MSKLSSEATSRAQSAAAASPVIQGLLGSLAEPQKLERLKTVACLAGKAAKVAMPVAGVVSQASQLPESAARTGSALELAQSDQVARALGDSAAAGANATALAKGVAQVPGALAGAKEVLAEAGVKAAGHAFGNQALKTGAKAAGRFIPGANIAISALDSAKATATLADPKAPFAKKASSVVTAVGSVAAATNIPIVSQVGAGVSAVSSVVGDLLD